MTGKDLICSIKLLVNCDQKIHTIKQTVSDKNNKLSTITKKIADLKSAASSLEKQIMTQRKEADFQKLQALELKQNEDAKRETLESLSNPKEYKALEKEIEAITRKRIELDEKIIKLWYNTEQATDQAQKQLDANINHVKELEQEYIEAEKNIATLNSEFAGHKAERTKLFSHIPQDWQNKYERMLLSVHDPIVPVSSSSCSSCYYSILTQDINKLKKDEILPCRNCYRFLYLDEEENQQAFSSH